jgi:hypothetical protein
MTSLFTAAFLVPAGHLGWKRIVRDLFFEYTGTTEIKHTEIWKFPRFLQVFLSN